MSSRPTRQAARRPRAEIDRNYFFGDLFLRTGVAIAAAILAVAILTPFSFEDALNGGMYAYLTIMGAFGSIGLACLIAGGHLRREATHWDMD